MVKPSQPKGIKPKAEATEGTPEIQDSSSLSGKKLLIVNTLITVLICFLFIGSNFVIVNAIVGSSLSKIEAKMNGGGGEGEGEGDGGEEAASEEPPERGIILDLGEFILNLSNPNSKRYLKVNVAIELSKAATDPDLNAAPEGGGGEHHGAAPNPLEAIQKEMEQFKPAIRDAVISVLSSKTAEEISSLSGKELAKEQIKTAIDPIFGGEREVIRVSFGTFIIQ